MRHEMWPKHQLLTTKLCMPALASPIIERPRLYTLLENAVHQPLTMLSAPPGWGKTTLVADWLQRACAELPCAWVSLSDHDNQPDVFWSYVLAAVGDALGNTNEFATLLDTTEPHAIEAALIQLINDLSARALRFILVIDNYQYIASPEIHALFAFVIEHLPKHVHVILLTSHDPPLPLPRWRVRGVVTEIRVTELGCTLDEVTAFVSSNEHLNVPGYIHFLVNHAEGWFAGLRLLSVALQRAKNTLPLTDDMSGAYLSEYVRNEILADQEAEICAFLLQTCVLDEMSAELCDAVLNVNQSAPSPSYRILRKLERLNLFVVPLDRQRNTYRYHRLFREALRYLLMQEEPDLFQQASLRASTWYQSHGQLDRAIDYALRGCMWEQAANLIEQWLHNATHLQQSDKLHRASEWIAQLPADIAGEQRFVAGLGASKPQFTSVKAAQIQFVHELGSPFSYTSSLGVTQHSWSNPSMQVLSAREQEVLTLIAKGASNYEIAEMLTLSLHTVKRHASNILSKLNAANRTQAVAHARTSGFLPAEPAVSYGMQT